jgi:hypothetical protein
MELPALYEGAGLDLCLEDRDEDGDVDGSDLYLFLKGFSGSAPGWRALRLNSAGISACDGYK